MLLKTGQARPRQRWLATSALALSAILLVALGAGGAALLLDDDTDAPVPPRPRAGNADEPMVGVFRGTDPEAVESYEQWLGRPVEVVVDYSARATWHNIANPDYLLKAWQDYDYTLALGVPMLPGDDESATIENGADGQYDDYFRTLAEKLVDRGHEDAILRVGWEFNMEDSRWATSDEDAFIEYWRRIVETMRSVPGQSFLFDWNLLNGDGNEYDAVEYYPGDDVVDIVGVDAYDQSGRGGTYPYPDDCDDACRAERQRAAWDRQIYGGDRGLDFWADFAAQHGKPLSLPEWGLWSREDGTGGGKNAFYLERMHEFINDKDNGVVYQAYFEFDGSDGEHRLMTRFPEAGELFRWLWTEDR